MVDPYPASSEPPPPVVPLDRPLRGASMPQAYGRYWTKYATFTGRASRSEFWYSVLANFLIAIVLAVISAALGTRILSYVWELAVLVPSLAVTARRLHDINRSGWWQLIGVIPGFLGTMTLFSGSLALVMIGGLIELVGGIILIVWCATGPRPEGVRFDV